MPHDEELFEVFFLTRIQTRGVVWDFKSAREFRRDVHAHVIAIRTLLAFLRRMLESTNPREKIPDIIRSLDIWNILDLTHLHERFVAGIVLTLGLDIRIVPKTNNIVFITQMEDGHRHIGTTAHVHEDFWFFCFFQTIELLMEDILRNLFRKTRNDEFWILRKQRLQARILRNTSTKHRRRNIGNMGIGEDFEIFDSSPSPP